MQEAGGRRQGPGCRRQEAGAGGRKTKSICHFTFVIFYFSIGTGAGVWWKTQEQEAERFAIIENDKFEMTNDKCFYAFLRMPPASSKQTAPPRSPMPTPIES